MPDVKKVFCCNRAPSDEYTYKIALTAKKSMKAIATCGINQLAKIKRKNIITPKFITQNERFLTITQGPGLLFLMSEKITDILMRDTGNEKPRKKVSNVSLGMVTQCIKLSFIMTGLDMSKPMERQSNDA